MGEVFVIISTVLFSTIIGLIGFWLRAAHKEIKEAIKQLTSYIYELNKTVVTLETHINKGIEQGISTNKEKIIELHERLEKVEDNYEQIIQKMFPKQ